MKQLHKQTSLNHRREEEMSSNEASPYSPKSIKHTRSLPRSINYLLREQRLLFILVGILIGSTFFIIQPTLSRIGPPETPNFLPRSGLNRLAGSRTGRVPVGIYGRRPRIVVTGGAGFVGSHLVDKLIARGDDVIVIDNFFTGRKENLVHLFGNPRFELIRHDVVEPILLEVDQIYHLACPASPVHYKYNPVKTIKTNVMGTLNMLGLAKRIGARFLLTSTSEVYGDPLEHPQKETYWGNVNPIGERSCYDEGKRTAETLAMDSPMAPISKLIPFLFLTTLLFSLQLHARESQFFSKVTPLNNLKQTEFTNNEASLNKPEQQQPVFLPQTENSYGLYGHETGLHPPSTTTTNAAPYTTPTTFQPYKTTTTEEDNNNNNFHSFNSKDAFGKQNDFSDTKFTEGGYSSKENQNNNYFYNNNDAFGKQNEFSDSKYTEGGYNSKENQNNNNYYYNSKDDFGKQNELSDTKYAEGEYKSMENQNNNDNAANERYYSNNNDNAANERYYYNSNKDNANNRYYKTKAVNNNYNSERQGLSDTRFVEGGKYFYDVNSEKYNNPTQYGGSSRGVSSENWSNNRGYFGNNNVNSYENKNSMEGYQNQEQFEDDQEDFEP